MSQCSGPGDEGRSGRLSEGVGPTQREEDKLIYMNLIMNPIRPIAKIVLMLWIKKYKILISGITHGTVSGKTENKYYFKRFYGDLSTN